MQDVSWNELQCFLEIARAGSFSAAARALGVEHSTLSRRLSALEARYGLHLFQRTRDGVELSPAGTEILALAQAAEERVVAVERRLTTLAEGGARVRVASSGILASGLLAPHLPQLLAAKPGLTLELRVSRSLVKLTRGEADIALRLRPLGGYVAEPSVIVSVLARVRWAAFAVSEEASRRAVISYSGPTRPGADWQKARTGAASVVVDEVPAALALARVGIGAAVLPCFLAANEPALKWRSEGLDEHRLVVAVSREQRQLEPIRSVVKWLRQVVAAEKHRLAGES